MFTVMKEPLTADGQMVSGHYLNYTATWELWYEKDYNPTPFTIFLQNYWWTSMIIAAAYAVAIFVLQEIMVKREPRKLKALLVLWNASLAIFSLAGSLRMYEEAYRLYQTGSLYEAVCFASQPASAFGFWSEAFMWSKVVELGDTLFIVMRKRPLIFLHWYHHVTVLVFSWHSCAEHSSPGRWFIIMNMSVHTLMYTYYAVSALGIRVPKRIAMFVTLCQTMQMVGGITIGVLVYQYKAAGYFCRQSWQNFGLCLLIYGTYLVLFVRFFAQAYLIKRPAKSPKPVVCGPAVDTREKME